MQKSRDLKYFDGQFSLNSLKWIFLLVKWALGSVKQIYFLPLVYDARAIVLFGFCILGMIVFCWCFGRDLKVRKNLLIHLIWKFYCTYQNQPILSKEIKFRALPIIQPTSNINSILYQKKTTKTCVCNTKKQKHKKLKEKIQRAQFTRKLYK